jgi:putative DNA primase/helicase
MAINEEGRRAATPSSQRLRTGDAIIPAELQKCAQWVCWKNIDRDGKPTKIPVQPDGTPASSTDSNTWHTFDEVQSHAHKYAGIGFVFSVDDDFAGVDLDGCRDPQSGYIEPWASEIIDRFKDAYIEVSPSKTGVKLFCHSGIQFDRGLVADMQVEIKYGKKPAIEIYSTGRYFAVTGQMLPGRESVGDCTEGIEWLKAKVQAIRDARKPTVSALAPLPSSWNHATPTQAIERARAYIAKMPPAISGQRGHDATLKVALALVNGFNLDEQDAMPLLSEYNQTCQPPWEQRDLQRKLSEARKLRNGDSGYLLKDGAFKTSGLRDTAQDADEQAFKDAKLSPSSLDVGLEAKHFLTEFTEDGISKLRYWLGMFFLWRDGRYEEFSKDEVRALICQHLNESYSKIGTSEVSDALEQVKCQCILERRTQPPCWLIGDGNWNPDEIVATKNALVHLTSLADGKERYSIPATPRFFTQAAVDYDFSRERRDCPVWMEFLHSLWGDDSQSIELLQDWFGYCLTPDTKHQKILMMLGPQRSGKGTIVRVLRGVVGEANCAGPTFSGIASHFGLSPLLGKSLAVISDARLSSRADQTVITERLLSISGEDALDIDKKFEHIVTTKLLTRLMIVSNEIPRLTETSGALAGRMLLLRLTKSFFGNEDMSLTPRLMAERDGILWWAIDGWLRLRERGYFVEPDSAVAMRNQLRELASPVGNFVDDQCELGSGYRVECQVLYEAWKEWCHQSGREPNTIQTFGRDLAAHCASVEAIQSRFGASRIRFYVGIRLRRDETSFQ